MLRIFALVCTFVMGAGCALGTVGVPLSENEYRAQFSRRLKEAKKHVKLPQGWRYDSRFPELKIIIIMPSWGNNAIYDIPLDAILEQKYSNYELWYIADNDHSPASKHVGLKVEEYARRKKQEHRIKVIRNTEQQLALANIYKVAVQEQDNQAIWVINDADDVLAHPYVLAYINYLHQAKNVAFTYGNSIFMSDAKKCSWSMPMPAQVVKTNGFRKWPHGPTHLRTGRIGLFKQLRIEDLFYKGAMFKKTYDVALFMPMLEMVGHNHAYVDDVLLIYNDLNPLNDHKVDQKEQAFLNTYIRSLPKYPCLKDLSIIYNRRHEMSADVVIVSKNIQETQAFLDLLAKKPNSLGSIFLLYQAQSAHEEQEYQKLAQLRSVSIESYKNIDDLAKKLKNLSKKIRPYVLFAYNVKTSLFKIDLAQCVSLLESTHAYGFYLTQTRDNARPYTLLSPDICAWQFDEARDVASLAAFTNMVVFPKEHFIALASVIKVSSKGNLEALPVYGNKILLNKVGLCYTNKGM